MTKAIQTTSYSKVQLRKNRALTIFAKTFLSLVAVVLLAPFNFMAPAFGQTEPPPPNLNNGPGDPGAGALSPGAQNTDPTAQQFPDEPPTNLVIQAAEQNKDTVITEVDELLTDNFRAYNETYQGLHTFWGDDIISNLFANIGQLIGKWLTEFINGWVSDTVQFLTGFLRVFVLNPNIAINGLNGNAADDISPYIRQAADVMYGIAVDLLLLLFILCIWKFWAEAAWRGGGNLLGAVGRLIFTSGLMLAWPTIYAFEIQITNEMIRTLYFNSADQVSALDAAMAAAVKGGLLAGAGLIANATAPIAGQAFGGILGAGPGGLVLGTVGSLVAFVGLIIYLVLGGILIAQLVYILVLKAIQTALLTAQYMFAPIFLVFFATPDTENVTSGFVKSFVEVSLWTFVWVGMLKIMVIMILSDFNPWGKIILAVGILQLMIQVPAFLARAQISPMSDFISAGLITGGLMKAGHALSDTLGKRGMQLAKYIGGDTTTGAARGGEMSKKVGLNGLAHGVRDPKLLNEMRQAQKGEHPSQLGKNLKPGDKGGDGKTPLGPDGKPIKPAGGPGAAMPGKPPEKDKDKDKKKEGADAVNPAAAAAAAGKDLNTAKKPGEAGGLDAGTAGKTAADALKKGLVGAGVAGGVGAGLAAMQGAKQGIGGNGAGGSDEEAKRAREAAEQAGMEAKNLANQINNGGLEDKDKDKNEPPSKTKLVDGKELKTGGADAAKPGDKQAKIGLPGSGADLNSALGGKGGANAVDPTKGTGANAGAGKDITQPVDRNLKPAGAGDKKEAGPGSKGVTDTKDLGAGAKDNKLDNGAGVPVGEDGRPLSMDVEDESANKVGLGLPPGVKLTPGAVTGGGDKDKNAQPPGKGVDSKDLGTGKTGKDGAAAAGGGPVLVGLKKPGANNQTAATKNSSDPVLAGLATATSVPTTGKNIDPTTALGDETATDDKGLVPEGTSLPKPLKGAGGSDKGGAVAGDGAKDVAAGGAGGSKQQPPVKTPGPQTVQIETSEKGGVNLVLPGVAVAATQKGIAGAGAGEQRIDSKTGDVVDAGGQGQGLQQPTELKSAGAVVPPGKLDTAAGANQADLKTDVTAGAQGPVKGGQGTVTQNVQVDSVGTTTPGVAVGLNLPGAKAIIPGAKIGDGLKLDARAPGGDPSVSATGQDQSQQTELKPGTGTVTGKIDGANAGPNQAELKTEVTGGPTLKPPGSAGTVTQAVQVDGANAGGQVPLNMPGARVNAKTNLQGQQLNADGGQVDADAEGVVTGSLGVPNVQGIVGKTQLDVGSVRPDGTAQAGTQGTGRVDVLQTTKPVQSAAASVTPLQAVATAGLRTRAAAVPGMQQMFDDGDEGGGEGGGGGGGGNKPPGGPPTGGPWQPPDDRPAHGVAPPSPFENRLNATGATRPIDNYQQAYYRWIPPRGISGAIRLAQGVTLGPSGHGGAELIGDTKGNTMHVRTGEGMDQDQMALQMMTAGYATLLGSDPHAYDAARAAAISAGEDQPKGWAQRMAAGILTYNGGSWAQTANAKNNFQRSMYQHAVEGSQAYVNGQPGNEYTEYLSQRYGTMSDKQQAFGVHLMTDPSSPESSWHWAHVPATETLVKNSIPINATARAVAANPNVFRARPWEQRAAITGGIQYMEARKAQEVPDVEPMVADAWVGREAQLLAPAVINTITALTSELGEDSCWDVAKVNNVASQVGAGKDQSEYVSCYRALANTEAQVRSIGSRTSNPPSPPTAGGGTGVVRGPGGGGGGGGATTSVSGTIVGGGGGGSGAATVDQVVELEPGQQAAANVPSPNLSGLTPPINPAGGQQVQTNIVWQAKPGFTPGQTVQGNGPIRMTANTPPAQLGQHTINQSSGNLSAPPMQPITNDQIVELEVVGTRMQNIPRVDQSQLKVPDINAPTQDVKTNVDFQVNGGRDSGGISGGTDRISVDAATSGTRVTSSSVSIGNAPAAAASNDITRNVRGEIQHRRSEYGSLNPDHLNSNVANLVNQFKDPSEAAFHIVYDLHAAGFSFDQIADDKIATTAIAVRAQDPSMMRTAAIAANALGADNFTVERTHVVQAMMDSDPRWSDHNIDDKSIYGAEAIMRVHDNYQQEMTSSDPGHPMGGIKAYPTKDFVDRVVMHPEFKPRPVSSSSGYNESVVNKIVERFKDRIAGRDPNYGGIYDNRGSGQPA